MEKQAERKIINLHQDLLYVQRASPLKIIFHSHENKKKHTNGGAKSGVN